MSETEDQSPFGRGFIAACIVIAAVLLCGALLLITGLTTDPTAASASTASSAADGSGSVGGSVAGSGEPSDPAATPSSSGNPSAAGDGARSGGCALPDGDQAIPSKAPSVDGWDVSRRVVVPRSASYGPAKTDTDGFRRCFAHSPTGAVFAAYSAVAALADQRQAIPTVQKLMVPGPNTQALIRELTKEEPSTDSEASQLAGYRILDADQDRATIMLAVPVESAYMSLTLTLIWHANDWHLQPPPPGEPVGAPYSQHRNLNDFVAWSGV
ncbi:hypothetical protein EV646_10789 [Kribbella antiqua]|uniref:DUF8175 domain-containing protein n=1 Tax=Kribbella antiqua TaxID=2512217 RepID=A0A4R2IPZ8_9ACTN|nr:hypothetical protein [Kribbella antiqua]TCO46068.1 hypothetical protein EV646_10789 [Kribbella antiqua]